MGVHVDEFNVFKEIKKARDIFAAYKCNIVN